MQVWKTFCGDFNRTTNFPTLSTLPSPGENFKNPWLWLWLTTHLKPCFPHALTTFLHVVFLLLFTIASLSPRHNTTSASSTWSTRKPASLYNRLSLFCCLYLFILNIGASLWGIIAASLEGGLALPIHFEAAAAAQAVSSWIMFLTINSRKQKGIWVSNLIQTWWMLASLLSFLSLLAGIMFFQEGSQYFWYSCLDYASFPASLLLGVCAIFGKMEADIEESDPQEPLLNAHQEGSQLRVPVTPYATAGVYGLATISWLNPLLSGGAKKHFELQDLPLLATGNCAERAYGDFKKSWSWLKRTNPDRAPSLISALTLSLWKQGAWVAGFAVVNVLATYVGPYLIDDFVEYLSGRRRFAHEGLSLVSIFFLAKIVENLSNRQWYLGSQLLGLNVKASLTGFLFQKGLRLSSQTRRNHTSAEIINYMAVDVQRIADFTWSINHFWILPLQIGLALAVLYRVVGIAWLAALASAILLLMINTPLTKLQEKFQSKVMEAKDERMKATSESLRNMRILKLQAWDDKYLQKIERIRVKEFEWLWKKALATASTVYIFWAAPIFVSTATFATCVILKIPLSAGQILTALATFRILQEPLDSFPEFISDLAQLKVTFEKVKRYT